MNVCVIGVGRLGNALLQGWMHTAWKRTAVSKHDVPEGVRRITVSEAVQADIVVVAVKPNDVAGVLKDLAKHWKAPGPIVLSVAVQPDLNTLENILAKEAAVMRAMPNIACAVGQSVTAYAKGRHVSTLQEEQVRRLWEACGTAIAVDENQMAAATALSGCGPAYAFRFVRALKTAGTSMGLDEKQAEKMARGIIQGAAGLVAQTPEKELGQWIGQVATPGGTTEAALKKWDENRFDAIVADGLRVAFEKNKTRDKK